MLLHLHHPSIQLWEDGWKRMVLVCFMQLCSQAPTSCRSLLPILGLPQPATLLVFSYLYVAQAVSYCLTQRLLLTGVLSPPQQPGSSTAHRPFIFLGLAFINIHYQECLYSWQISSFLLEPPSLQPSSDLNLRNFCYVLCLARLATGEGGYLRGWREVEMTDKISLFQVQCSHCG